MVELKRRDMIESVGTVLLGSIISETAAAQETSGGQELVNGDQLLAHWPLEDSFEDEVGGNDASPDKGNPTVGRFDGRDAVSFDGDDGLRVSRGGNEELNLMGPDHGPVSFSMWVYFDERTGGQPFEGTGTPHHSLLRHDTGYRITASPVEGEDLVYPRFRIAPYGEPGAVDYRTHDNTITELSLSEWHHLVVVVDSTRYVRIYVNGNLEFSDDSMEGHNADHTEWWNDITIGSWYGGNPEEWANLMRGKISDLRIYDTDLSADEVSRIYTNTGGDTEGTETGTNSPDRSGTGGTEGEPNQAGSTGVDDTGGPQNGDSGLEGVATMFRKSVEDPGATEFLLGGGVLGGAYLAYRRRKSDEDEVVDKEPYNYCTNCGMEVGASNAFCGNCGVQLNDTEETNEQHKTETEHEVRVSEYADFSVGEVIERKSAYKINKASLSGTHGTAWVITPSTEGSQTLDVSQTQGFIDKIEPWTKIDSHPNLLQVYGYGTEPLPWLAVEPAEYPSMRDVADDFSENQKVEVLSQICEAVHHVHRYGIVYENLSPERVKLTHDGQVKLAGVLDDLNNTPGSEVTERTVVHRIGNIAKYLLIGDSSEGFPGETEGEINKALSEQPSERHDTVLHFRDELKRTCDQG